MPDKHQEICGRFAKLLSDLRRLNRDGSESRRFRSQPSQPASTDTDVTNKETGVRKPGTDSDAKAKGLLVSISKSLLISRELEDFSCSMRRLSNR